MNEWKILNSQTIDLEGNNFLEITLKEPPQSDAKLLTFSKGWYTEDKSKRYKNNILIDSSKKKEIIDAINSVCN